MSSYDGHKLNYHLMRKLLFLFIISFLVNYSYSQPPKEEKGNGSISGTVIDKDLGTAVEYANIVIYSQVDSSIITGTITTEKGNFEIKDLPRGQYYLVVDFIGYNDVVIHNLVISNNQKTIQLPEIELIPAVQHLDGVEVVGEKSRIEYKIDKKVINVDQYLNSAGGSAAEVLENVPSVKVDIDGNVTLRGSDSFTVLIDGKPSVIPGSEVLKQIPANAIDNIEIITNPSAKYDPDGTTGIINIIMKKEKNNGFNGFVNTTVATWNKFGGTLNLNQRNNKNNYFISANYNRTPTKMTSWENRMNLMNDIPMYLDENSDRIQIFRPWNITGGVDYFINDNNTLTLSAGVGGFGYFREFETTYHSYTDTSGSDKYITSDHNFNTDGIYYTTNANLQHSFVKKGHELDVSVSVWKWHGNQDETSDEVYTDSSWKTFLYSVKNRFSHESFRDNLRINVDYVLPVRKGKFEAGLFTHLNPGTSEFIYEDFDVDVESWVNNPMFTNSMDLKRNIYAAYATFSDETRWFNYQLGLRGEYTERMVDQKTTNEQYPMEFFNYYPSFHISKNLPKQQQLQAGYSRRINRPQAFELNPFPGYSDSYNFSKGNPELKPEDIDAIELNYLNHIKKGLVSMGLYYRVTHDTKVMDIIIDDQNRLYLFNDNLDETYAIGTELMANYNVCKWLSLNLGGNLYQYEIQGSITGNDVDKQSFNWDSRLTASFKLSQTCSFQINGNYSSPSVQAIGTLLENYFAGVSFRKDIMKKMATITLNVVDLFGTSEYRISTDRDDYKSEISFKSEAPVVRLSFSYRINNYQRRQQDNIDLGVGAG